MLRQRCVICNEQNKFRLIHKQEAFPICISSSTQPIKDDVLSDVEYIGCEVCGCVQIKTLIDPELLYSFSHNNTYETPTWKEHHNKFSQFILNLTNHNSFLEIGGASGYLGELLSSQRKINTYTILDLASKPVFQVPIKYIQGNCETFDYTKIQPETPIILSHVLEHLYEPKQFLQQLRKARIQHIVLSIPNMEVCLEKRFLSFLHREHTYYCSTQHLLYMMAEAGFECRQQESFREHSLFFWFERSETVASGTIVNPEKLLSQFEDYYHQRGLLYKDVELKEPTYIVPAGHYGQLIYFFLQAQKEAIVGFLDNDASKIGKRMYGTDTYVYPMKFLETKQDTPVSVLLNAGPYLQEIKAQLEKYHPNIRFICI